MGNRLHPEPLYGNALPEGAFQVVLVAAWFLPPASSSGMLRLFLEVLWSRARHSEQQPRLRRGDELFQPKDLVWLDSCDEHRKEGFRGRYALLQRPLWGSERDFTDTHQKRPRMRLFE
ncbi:hypothetical protein F2981_07385 [Sinorhizobium meliloti]|nr:hypothetical protein [Sinorhizobium meliloti]